MSTVTIAVFPSTTTSVSVGHHLRRCGDCQGHEEDHIKAQPDDALLALISPSSTLTTNTPLPCERFREWNLSAGCGVNNSMMSVEGRPLNDTSLISQARAGDVRAYEELVRIHQGVALRVAYLITRDHAEAEDVGSGRIRQGISSAGTVRSRSAVSTLDPGHRPQRGPQPQKAGGSSGATADPPRQRGRLGGFGSIPREPRRRFGDAAWESSTPLTGLPQRQRLVIGLRYLVGLSEAETAATLGVPVGTVKSRANRALERLRVELEASAIHRKRKRDDIDGDPCSLRPASRSTWPDGRRPELPESLESLGDRAPAARSSTSMGACGRICRGA